MHENDAMAGSRDENDENAENKPAAQGEGRCSTPAKGTKDPARAVTQNKNMESLQSTKKRAEEQQELAVEKAKVLKIIYNLFFIQQPTNSLLWKFNKCPCHWQEQ